MWEEFARRELAGVGDPALGEWIEHGDIALHLRRRLSAREAQRAKIDVCDIRHTDEHLMRIERMRPYLPPALSSASAAGLINVG